MSRGQSGLRADLRRAAGIAGAEEWALLAVAAAVFAGGQAAFLLEDAGEVALVEEACFGGDVR